MFDEIRKDKHRKPLLTYFIALISIIVTLTTIINPEYSYTYFGSIDGGVSLLSIFTIPFQHGFDPISSLIHLCFVLFFYILLGSVVEKIMGPEKYTYLIIVVSIFYSMYVFFSDQPGHGLSPFVFAMSPILISAMLEAIDIKLSFSFTSGFKFFRNAMLSFLLVAFVMFTFVPIYFKINDTTLAPKTKNISTDKIEGGPAKKKVGKKFNNSFMETNDMFGTLVKGLTLGNLANLIGFFIGGYFGYKYKKRIGGTLIRFNKRKELSEKSYKPVYIFASVMSGYILLVYVTSIFY